MINSIKSFFSNSIVQIITFFVVFIGIGCLANVIWWMKWPALVFYGAIMLGIIVLLVISCVNLVKQWLS